MDTSSNLTTKLLTNNQSRRTLHLYNRGLPYYGGFQEFRCHVSESVRRRFENANCPWGCGTALGDEAKGCAGMRPNQQRFVSSSPDGPMLAMGLRIQAVVDIFLSGAGVSYL